MDRRTRIARRKSTCCCNFSTRDGTKIIAILSIVIGLYAVVDVSYSIFLLSHDTQQYYEKEVPTIYRNDDADLDKWMVQLINQHHVIVYTHLAASIINNAINIILSCLLFVGASDGEETNILPWFYFQLITFIIVVILYLICIGFLLIWKFQFVAFKLFVTVILACLIQIYVLNIVKQYLLELREVCDSKRISTTTTGGHNVAYYSSPETRNQENIV